VERYVILGSGPSLPRELRSSCESQQKLHTSYPTLLGVGLNVCWLYQVCMIIGSTSHGVRKSAVIWARKACMNNHCIYSYLVYSLLELSDPQQTMV
jgi:hypothetical protein